MIKSNFLQFKNINATWQFGLTGETILPNYTLPAAIGTEGQALKVVGGVLAWSA